MWIKNNLFVGLMFPRDFSRQSLVIVQGLGGSLADGIVAAAVGVPAHGLPLVFLYVGHLSGRGHQRRHYIPTVAYVPVEDLVVGLDQYLLSVWGDVPRHWTPSVVWGWNLHASRQLIAMGRLHPRFFRDVVQFSSPSLHF